MKIEFRDLKRQYSTLKPELDQAIGTVLSEAKYISGPQVANLENRLAEYVGTKHCLSCANGTDALSLVLMAWGIGEGDAVFVPNFTFFASAEVIAFEGATPVFVDVDRETFNICPVSLEGAIQSVVSEGKLEPKVLITVDLFGLPANYPQIESIARKYNLKVLEDAAQGFGGAIGEKRACSFGHAATTSFFPAKPLGCYGDGGAIFTNDDELASVISSLKIHGKGSHKYDNVRIGVNSRLDTLQAAILNIKFDAFVNYELEAVNSVFEKYNEALSSFVQVPIVEKPYYSSFAQYTIRLKNEEERDGLAAYLKSLSVPTMVYYQKTMHEQRAFEGCITYTDFNRSSELTKTCLSLPMHPYLSDEEITYIVDCFNKYFE